MCSFLNRDIKFIGMLYIAKKKGKAKRNGKKKVGKLLPFKKKADEG